MTVSTGSFLLKARPHWLASRQWRYGFGALAITAVFATSYLVAATAEPVVARPMDLADTPLYAAGAAAQRPTLTLALSVEFPTAGAAYRDTYTPSSNYLGYFDNASCYDLVTETTGDVFVRVNTWNDTTRDCGGKYSGNFMNWATASAIDILRFALTGGDRIIDTASDTVLQRAYLPYQANNPVDFFGNGTYFPTKSVTWAVASKLLPSSLKPAGTANLTVKSCKERAFFNSAATSCPTSGGTQVRVRVCNANGGQLNDPRSSLCLRYPNGGYKPVGAVQKYSDNVRLAAFGYLSNADPTTYGYRYGGVLRAPMKWVGLTSYDKDGTPVAGLNPRREWDDVTGVYVTNPEAAAEGVSGVVNYLNQFGRLGSTLGDYKKLDPVSELYYEALRYLQGLQPTPAAVSNMTAALRGGFPVYDDWTNLDPYKDGAATGDYSCIRNNIFAVGDVNTHADWSIPGNTRTANLDFSRAANVSNNEPNFVTWANVVGGFESGGSVGYTYTPPSPDGGLTQPAQISASTSNPNSTPLPGATLSGLGGLLTGANSSGSYLMAGMAYWANTQDIRGKNWTSNVAKQRPGMRVRTYMLDVNENNANSTLSARQKTQFFLTAKYGGFSDQSGKANPFLNKTGQLDNSNWSNDPSGQGDPKTYFLSNSAQAVIDAVNQIFARAAAEGNNITGAALSSNTTQASAGNVLRFYNSRFNGADWSGNVVARPLVQNTDGSLTLASESSTNGWDAETRLRLMTPANRNIVMGSRSSSNLVSAAALPTSWNDLPPSTRTDMTTGLMGTLLGLTGTALTPYVNYASGLSCGAAGSCPSSTDRQILQALGDKQLAFLRGQVTDASGQALGGQSTVIGGRSFTLRNRANLLGDIVNSVVTYSGAPTTAIADADYQSFYTANKNRAPTVFVGANDGMLHAFDAATGDERFAYIPSWMAKSLPALTDSRYGSSVSTPHKAFVDAPPTVGEAKAGDTWKTVLVSGTGGGGQGVFALDVSNPSSFAASQLMWEFTDKDDPTLGNVIGAPQIAKVKVGLDSKAQPIYKWFAMVASGVNNYVPDGSAATTADPYLFMLDLGKPTASAWQEGTNYYKLKVPADTTLNATVAPGVIEFSITSGPASDLAQIYVGDLHGRLWKIDYATQFIGSKSIATTVAQLNSGMGVSTKPLFTTQRVSITDPSTKQAITVPQAISAAPIVVAGPVINQNRTAVVMFGTGKYLENSDNILNAQGPRQSVYAVLDDGSSPVTNTLTRTSLQPSQISGTTVSTPSFQWGAYNPSSTRYPGWYLDFATSLSQGERQLTPLVTFGTQVFFNSLIPPGGATNPCASTGSRAYSMNFSSGNGSFRASTLGNLSMPTLIITDTVRGAMNNAGGRTVTIKARVIAVSGSGIDLGATANGPDGSPSEGWYKSADGPVSWRLIENYQQLRSKVK